MLTSLRSWLGDQVLRLGSRVHQAIAVLALLVIVGDALTYQSFKTVSGGFFDTLVTLRPSTPKPDPKVVIVDIDEGSLAEVGKTHGRWPWPNEVFADVLVALEQHQVKQIAFDIMFSDRDVLRPSSEERFFRTVDDVGKRLPIYFPMVRLNPDNDAKSQVPTGALPGARNTGGQAKEASTIAVILPQVPPALDQGHLAFLNVYPDRDGVIRQYPTGLSHDGWSFDSYAVRIARGHDSSAAALGSEGSTAGALSQQSKSFWLNWRGAAFTYRYISIKDVLDRGPRSAALTEQLRGATVIIGSTAPALQDLKATPVATPFPGVEILATAIDNLANRDEIHAAPAWFNAAVAVLFVVVLAYLFTQGFKPDQINLMFLGIQLALIGLAWFMLSFFNYFLNFSGAVTYGAVFFAIAKVSTLQLLPMGREALFRRMCSAKPSKAVVVALDVEPLPAKSLRYLNERVVLSGQESGWLLAAALEPDEDSGTFGAAFHQVLVFTRLLSAVELGAALMEEIQRETGERICAELDKAYPQRKVHRMVITTTEIASVEPTQFRRLGSVLFARGVDSLFPAELS